MSKSLEKEFVSYCENQNLEVKQKSFYNEDISTRSFSNQKEDDPWI